jgi:hypothetical protein
MSLHEALSDINSCCPFVFRYGGTITNIDWTFDDNYISFGYFSFHTKVGCFQFRHLKTLEEAIDWLSNYPVVTKKRWTIAREVLNIVLIPDVVEFVLEDYVVDSIKIK